jgi:hypothetical protein
MKTSTVGIVTGEVMKQQSPQSATSPAGDQLRKPMETGKLPSKNDAVLSKVEIDGRTYSERVWKGDIDGH